MWSVQDSFVLVRSSYPPAGHLRGHKPWFCQPITEIAQDNGIYPQSYSVLPVTAGFIP